MLLAVLTAAITAIAPAEPYLDAKTSAAVANYLLMSKACDLLIGSVNFAPAHDEAVRILLTAGYSLVETERMIEQLFGSTLAIYTAKVHASAEGSDEAIRYFCFSALSERRQAVADVIQTLKTNR